MDTIAERIEIMRRTLINLVERKAAPDCIRDPDLHFIAQMMAVLLTRIPTAAKVVNSPESSAALLNIAFDNFLKSVAVLDVLLDADYHLTVSGKPVTVKAS